MDRARREFGRQARHRHELDVSGVDEVSLGPAVLAGCRTAGSLLCVEPEWAGLPAGEMPSGTVLSGSGPDVAVMPLAGPAILVTALAGDALTLRQRLRRPASAQAPLAASD